MKPDLLLLAVVAVLAALGPLPGSAGAALEDELVIQTPMSAFVVDSMLKEFVRYAREKSGVTVKTRVLRAGTPVSYQTIVRWNGQPEADVFWGSEPTLFDDLALRKLLTKLEIAADVWEASSTWYSDESPVAVTSRLLVADVIER